LRRGLSEALSVLYGKEEEQLNAIKQFGVHFERF
jgi:hypothetical protein